MAATNCDGRSAIVAFGKNLGYSLTVLSGVTGHRWQPGLILVAAAAVLAVAAHLGLLLVRGTAPVVSGDEGTFLAMTASLAHDGDLEFGTEDRDRLTAAAKGGRKAVILQRTESGIAYSKPSLYPLLAAPWVKLFGEWGAIVTNLVFLSLAVVFGWAFLRRSLNPTSTAWTLLTVLATGVLMSYVAWTMSDSVQASLALIGMILCVGVLRGEPRGGRLDRLLESRAAPVLGGVLLGAVVAMRYPNFVLALAAPTALLLNRKVKRALSATVALALTLGLAFGVNQLLTGAAVPYKAERATFNPLTGYPAGEEAAEVVEQFETGRATHRMGVRPVLEPLVSAHAAVYFLLGRHTGLLWYFPAAALLVWTALRRPDRLSWVLLLAIAAVAGFYLLWMPRNYFGGATFVGNRYFLTAYPLLMLAPLARISRRGMAVVWLLALVVFLSAVRSSALTRESDGTSQMHAHAGLFRWLPYESTAPDLDGREDRYWSDELIRFVDPYATVEDVGFRLSTDRPDVELVTASGRDHGLIRLFVQADVPQVDVVYRDWLQRRRFRLTAEEGGAAGFLEVEPSPTLRRHPYWWDPEAVLNVRSFRLRLESPRGGAASAEVRYGGPYRLVPKFYRAELQKLQLPGRRRPGRVQRLPIRLRNTGRRYWATDDPIPVLLGYRIRSLPAGEGSGEEIVSLAPIPGKVAPGGEVESVLEVAWPETPGRYEIVVDLVVAGHAWFAEWNGQPLAQDRVRIVEENEE